MVPRAIADSDNEESDEDTVGIPRANCSEGKRNMDTPLGAIAAPSTKSTNSTEQLRRDLQCAQRRIWTDSASGEMRDAGSQPAMTPTALAGSKRRHTAALTLEASPASSSGIKRAKTSRASSPVVRTHAQAEAGTGGSFATTSQTAMFTEHSETDSSDLLPRDSLQEDFLNHEPSVMFPESGSTVVDDSSAQRQMLRALNKNDRPLLSPSFVNTLNPNGLENSSLPWSAFESNGRPGSSGGKQEPPAETATEDASAGQAPASDKLSEDVIHVAPPEEGVSKQAQSPVVEIRQSERRVSVSNRASLGGSPITSKRRKEKAEEEQHTSDVLNSDDRAIGLPKERYQPRPTKRRATAVLEEPVDFSVRPEKAAKVKRTKTADATSFQTHEEVSITARIISALGKGSVQTTDDPDATPLEEIAVRKEAAANESKDTNETAQESNVVTGGASTQHKDSQEESAAAARVISTAPTPAPPSKKKSSTKAKRAQTTIFEDHMEFTGSQRSLNLSQQQASRKAALKTVKKGAEQRKRRTIFSDDEDEDSSARDADEMEDTEPLPKKRGRGRPPKVKVKPSQKSAEKVLEDSDSEADAQANDLEGSKETCEESTLNDPPDLASNPAETSNVPALSPLPQPKAVVPHRTEDDKEASHTAEPMSTPENTPTATKIPMPSPEKENAAPQQQAFKGSPTSHSPIKGSSKVPLRVGLSKRQRIPSLLRVMKPPKQ